MVRKIYIFRSNIEILTYYDILNLAFVVTVPSLGPEIVRMDAERLDNFRAAYHDLADRVRIGLRTQAGNVEALHRIREQCIRLLASAQTVR
jgi:hypothetical protein